MSIHKAMIAVMMDIGAIGKGKYNQQQKFNFRGIDDVYNNLHQVMARHGVFTTSEILDETRTERTSKNGGVLAFVLVKMRYTFWAGDGSSVSTEVIGEGMDPGDKATNKAMSIAHKYALLQAFLVPTEDMVDPDAESVELASQQTITQAQVKQLRQMLADIGRDEVMFLRHIKAQSFEDIRASSFDECVRIIEAAKRRLDNEH